MEKPFFMRTMMSVMLLSILIAAGCTKPVPSATPEDAAQTPTAIGTTVPTTESMTPQPEGSAGTLFANPDNPRYFTDGTMENGKYRSVFLTGSHTWCNFTDCGNTNPPPIFDYREYLDFLEANNHNFFRLWRAENARGGEAGPDFWFNPMPYQRSTTCCAFDGGNKFDLEQLDQAYFDRLRERVIAAGNKGIYVSIMLFDGWSVESKMPNHNPWAGHPYKLSNNINNINGDLNNDNQGGETHTLANNQVTALQEAYVRKVIDSVNDLDNVLYEISNESPGNSEAWQYHLINYIKSYEASKPKQHPVGMTVEHPGGDNQDLYNSPADWISLLGNVGHIDHYTPPVATGNKVILADTDHLCGICGNRQWVWKSFTRGENPIFMDFYDNAVSGRGIPFKNPYQDEIRVNMGYVRDYAERINLTAMLPLPNLCSSGYCLANPVPDGAEYLVFLPAGSTIAGILKKLKVDRKVSINLPTDSIVSVDLSNSPVELSVEWFNPQDGTVIDGGTIQGGSLQSFSAPFSGDAVLYVHDSTP